MIFGTPRLSNLEKLKASQWLRQRDDGGRELRLHNLVLDSPCIDYLIAQTQELQIEFNTDRPFESVSIQCLETTGWTFRMFSALVVYCVASEVHIKGGKSRRSWLKPCRRSHNPRALGEENGRTVLFLKYITETELSSIKSLVFENVSVSESIFGACLGVLFIDPRCQVHALSFYRCCISHVAARAIRFGLEQHIERTRGGLKILRVDDCKIETEATQLILVDCLFHQDPSRLKHLTLTYKNFQYSDVPRIVRILQKHTHLRSLRIVSKSHDRRFMCPWNSFAARDEEQVHFHSRLQNEVVQALQRHAHLTNLECAFFRPYRDIITLPRRRHFLHQLRFLQEQRDDVPLQAVRVLAIPYGVFPFLLERSGSDLELAGKSLMFLILQQVVVPTLNMNGRVVSAAV